MAQKQIRPVFADPLGNWDQVNGTLPFAGPVDEDKVEALRLAYETSFNDNDSTNWVEVTFEVQDFDAEVASPIERAVEPHVLAALS